MTTRLTRTGTRTVRPTNERLLRQARLYVEANPKCTLNGAIKHIQSKPLWRVRCFLAGLA